VDELILRLLRCAASRQECAALDAWRRSAPANERYYREVERVWTLTGLLARDASPRAPPSAGDVLRGNAALGTPHRDRVDNATRTSPEEDVAHE
jgi:ferric-dicitrate binding protein FerR (iron transport regulator)